ncbi:MAG: hypothetical protein FJX74_09320, partial [Armatimonadetes bacterium]|nr:hypothetical protein [Armatimonadota bacterium]
MALCVMPKQALPTLIEQLAAQQKIVGPKRIPRGPGSSQFGFGEVKSADELDLDYPYTILPPKHWLLPRDEKLFAFKLGPLPEVAPVIESEPTVFFGLHPPDIAGIACLDETMSDRNPDPNYLARREQITIVGTEISPDEYTYAKFVGNDVATSGYDLFLTDIGDAYVCDVATEKGQAIVNLVETRPATADDLAAVEAARRQTAEKAQDV